MDFVAFTEQLNEKRNENSTKSYAVPPQFFCAVPPQFRGQRYY